MTVSKNLKRNLNPKVPLPTLFVKYGIKLRNMVKYGQKDPKNTH